MSENFDMGYIAGLSGLSPEAQKFFRNMKEPDWTAWQPRYHALLDLAKGKQRTLPDIQWWEQAFLDALLSHSGMIDRINKI
jgi:hypothetical protein